VLLRGRRGDAVRERDHVVALLVAAPHRRLDAAVREEAAERDRRDSAGAEDEVEVGRRERVEAALPLGDDVALLRRERVDDLGAPLALDERARVDDALEDPVGLVGELAVARREGDRSVDYCGAGGPRRVDHAARVLEHPGLLHDATDSVM
jgi:hypothetical protein